MTQPSTPLRALEGPGSAERLRRLQRRFERAGTPRRLGRLTRIGRRLLVVYWASCLAVIAVGLDKIYPEVRPALAARLAPLFGKPLLPAAGVADWQVSSRSVRPALSTGLTHPFRTCAAAHAAGVYDIPTGSPAYLPQQDGDGDGLACEPH